MHIIELQVENYKRLRAARVTPEGHIVDIVGRNGQGKSSLLDSIYAVLAGASALPSKPIRKGSKSSTIVVKIGDDSVKLVVKRHFTRREDDSYLTSVTVENADGAVYRSPQTMLDGLLDSISFDPSAFARMPAKDQLTELRKLVPGFDFVAVDDAIRGDFTKRTDVNRRLKEANAELSAARIPGDPAAVEVNETALVDELARVGEQKAAIERERASRQDRARNVRIATQKAVDFRFEADENVKAIAELQRRIDHLRGNVTREEASAKEHDGIARNLQAELEALPPLEVAPDTAAIMAKIDAARKANADFAERARALTRHDELVEKVAKLEVEAKTLTESIAKRERTKADAIAAAKLPVAGLSFTADGVLLNELPFEQASDAEKLRASIAESSSGAESEAPRRADRRRLRDALRRRRPQGFGGARRGIRFSDMARGRPGRDEDRDHYRRRRDRRHASDAQAFAIERPRR